MKIVEIIPYLTSGGAERFTVDLTNELTQRHEVWLVLFYPMCRTDLHFLLPEVSSRIKVLSLDKHRGFDAGLIHRLARTLRTIAPDVVHCHINAFEYVFMAKVLGHFGCRCYYTVHSEAKFDASGWLGGHLRRFAFRRGLITPVTISAESLLSFRAYYGMDAALIPNGRKLFTKTENQTKEKNVLVSIARFTKVKRQDMLARIVRRLEQEGYRFTLQLIGQHQDKDVLCAVQAVGCSCVEIVGEVSNPLDYLRCADAFLLCSTHEGMPISLIEAMSAGAIPVCTPVGGIVNMVTNGVCGILSEDSSEDSYYHALKRFLDMQEENKTIMRKQAMHAASAYGIETCACRYEQLWFAK